MIGSDNERRAQDRAWQPRGIGMTPTAHDRPVGRLAQELDNLHHHKKAHRRIWCCCIACELAWSNLWRPQEPPMRHAKLIGPLKLKYCAECAKK